MEVAQLQGMRAHKRRSAAAQPGLAALQSQLQATQQALAAADRDVAQLHELVLHHQQEAWRCYEDAVNAADMLEKEAQYVAVLQQQLADGDAAARSAGRVLVLPSEQAVLHWHTCTVGLAIFWLATFFTNWSCMQLAILHNICFGQKKAPGCASSKPCLTPLHVPCAGSHVLVFKQQAEQANARLHKRLRSLEGDLSLLCLEASMHHFATTGSLGKASAAICLVFVLMAVHHLQIRCTSV